jgi:hypothetical protein
MLAALALSALVASAVAVPHTKAEKVKVAFYGGMPAISHATGPHH